MWEMITNQILLTTRCYSYLRGYLETVLPQSMPFWWETQIFHEALFRHDYVLINNFSIRLFWLTLFTLLSLHSFLVVSLVKILILFFSQAFNSLSFLRSYFSRWILRSQYLGTIFAKYFQFSGTTPIFQFLSKTTALFRISQLILRILLNKHLINAFKNYLILTNELLYNLL